MHEILHFTSITITTNYTGGGRPAVTRTSRSVRYLEEQLWPGDVELQRVRRRKGQKRGILPLAALIPALIAGVKAVAAEALSEAAGYGVQKRIEAIEKKRRRRRKMYQRRRRRRRRRFQRGGAPFRRRPTLIDKIAEGIGMFLLGPSPTFATMGGKLVSEVF